MHQDENSHHGKRPKTLRDPVHKDIRLSPAELALIDTPGMQRLRGIRQLGAAFYVYPGAQHSRFEHSLGTCWMAKKIMASIEQRNDFAFPESEKRAVCLASLAHDITHIPFGHTFEDERKLMPRHDRSAMRYEYFLENGLAGKVLMNSDAGRLALRILHPQKPMPEEKQYLRQIVSGTICADLLDYLKRDNYFCGLSQEYDERVFHYFTIDGGELRLALHRHGLFRRDALSEITNLLRIRYVLSERVYYHHAKIACGVMISKAVERALAQGMQEQEFFSLTDDALPGHLRRKYGHDDGLAVLLDGLASRRMYKRCYLLSREIGEDAVKRLVDRYHDDCGSARANAEQRIAEALRGHQHEVAIYCSPEHMALKEANMPVIPAPHRTERFCDINTTEIRVLQQQHRQLWKFYVFVAPRLADRLEEAGHVCEEVFGLPNELPREMRGANPQS